ncbi:MAG: hypothetical protein QOH95_2667 [Gaiellaceae bacterium]|nr:hypothetical protein [Gaiellaceae bacterium]
MFSTKATSIALAGTLAVAVAVSIAPAASASGPGTRVAGVCSASSTSFLKVKRDNGLLQVEFEVDQNRTGVAWQVRLRRNGATAFAGTRTTTAPSGSFSLERRLAGGPAVIRARAMRNGEVCTATLTGSSAAAAAATATVAGPKLRGDGTVDDTTLGAAASGADRHGGNSATSGSAGSGNSGLDDHGHHGSHG